jgi:hypothetical protein
MVAAASGSVGTGRIAKVTSFDVFQDIREESPGTGREGPLGEVIQVMGERKKNDDDGKEGQRKRRSSLVWAVSSDRGSRRLVNECNSVVCWILRMCDDVFVVQSGLQQRIYL